MTDITILPARRVSVIVNYQAPRGVQNCECGEGFNIRDPKLVTCNWNSSLEFTECSDRDVEMSSQIPGTERI